MYDYAQAQLLGRATEDAELENINDPDKVSIATFTLACNIGYRRRGKLEKETVFRTIVAIGSFANYVADCQKTGLTGRLINIIGQMADIKVEDNIYEEIVRVAPGQGIIKIMDKRLHDNE
jgi:hypothetical protein